MSDAALADNRGSFAALQRRRSDPRRPLRVLLGALSVATLAYLAHVGLGAYDVFVGVGDAETDPRPVTVTVGPVAITVPRNMIRDQPVGPGSVSQLDLRMHWPTLEGYTEPRAAAFKTNNERSTIIYATISPSQGSMSPRERQQLVYTRLLEDHSEQGPAGLTATSFGSGYGYDGEVLYTSPDPANPFVARCTPDLNGVPPTCIVEFRTADGIDVLYRFRKHLLARWKSIDAAMRKTVTSFILDR